MASDDDISKEECFAYAELENKKAFKLKHPFVKLFQYQKSFLEIQNCMGILDLVTFFIKVIVYLLIFFLKIILDQI
jgi:hypothetical protein